MRMNLWKRKPTLKCILQTPKPLTQETTSMSKDLHEQAGLSKWDLNGDGEQEWVGTREQWSLYERMEMAEENDTLQGHVEDPAERGNVW